MNRHHNLLMTFSWQMVVHHFASQPMYDEELDGLSAFIVFNPTKHTGSYSRLDPFLSLLSDYKKGEKNIKC